MMKGRKWRLKNSNVLQQRDSIETLAKKAAEARKQLQSRAWSHAYPTMIGGQHIARR